ncbi:MAG: transcription termination factor Rho [Clostridia bacterium]|nr:transcription termination factor Rho [Clostridia bacterium]
MTLSELQSMTVIQLRKAARDNHIVLGAGIDKTGMIEKIAAAMGIKMEPVQQSFLDAAAEAAIPAESIPEADLPSALEAAPKQSDNMTETQPEEKQGFSAQSDSATPVREAPSEPRFQAAWHSPDSPHQASHTWNSSGSSRPAWQNTSPSGRPLGGESRPAPLRTHSFGPRFGPAASATQVSEREPAAAPTPEAAPRPAASPLPNRRVGFPGSGSFGPRAATPSTAPAAEPAASASIAAPPALQESNPSFTDGASSAPTLEELLAAGDFEEASGILELHPDGYGFLRSTHFLPSSRDIYVSMAQIRRFSLRTGDLIQGKIRPQREGDKYAALLYIDTVNGLPEDEASARPFFDELTPVYPTRKISLETAEGLPSLRMIDLIAPLGFGQRALLLCPPETGKRELLRDYARVITGNYPDATVLTLLIDMTPEDVTAFRESVPCPVLASTFDQAPETHLRLAEMVMERAMRLVEQKKDVVILADSLTRLAKIYTTAAVQQGRSVPGMVNPASLLRAKRLFGAARSVKEGGSLTVIAAMDIATGNKVDDSIVEEFKGTANMELVLDQAVARSGITPAVNLQRSFTKNTDILLNDQQKEGLSLMRQMLGSTTSTVAIPQLLSMMEKAPTNADLLMKMKGWYALMSQAKP